MFDLFKYSSDPIVATVEQFLEKQEVKVTRTAIKNYILSHPDYPSLLSISDCLTYLNVENTALKVSKEELEILPLPLITFSSKEFQIITYIGEKKIEMLQNNGKETFENKDTFNGKWSNIVLLAEKTDDSGEKKTNGKVDKKSKANSAPLVLVATILIFISLKLHDTYIRENLYISTLFTFQYLLKTMGLLTSMALFWAEIDIYNPSLKKICSGLGIKTNCNAVLNSSYAKTSIGFSWGEIGIIYFICTLLLIISNPNFINITSTISLASAAIILLSLYTQAVLIKQWCPLCLLIQITLLAELITSTLYLINFQETRFENLTIKSLIEVVVTFTIVTTVIYFLKPLILSQLHSDTIKYEFERLKRNYNIFNLLQSKYQKLNIPNHLGITIGNIEAENTLVKVCNPYCSPCSNAHPEIIKLIENNKNIKIQILYNATLQDYDLTKEPVRHFLALSKENNQTDLIKSLNEWYKDKDKNYSKFSKKNPVKENLSKYNSQIEEMHNWLVNQNILVTPTYYYNGKPLPNPYKVSDLEYLNFN